MYENDIFVFGSTIIPEVKTDRLSSLPLELSWKIFSYLDCLSLRAAMKTHKIWRNIIISNKKLKKKLNNFENLAFFGSDKMLKFYKKNKRKLKMERRNYLPVNEATAFEEKPRLLSKKRQADTVITVYAKRLRLF